jgi:hypothetical protein
MSSKKTPRLPSPGFCGVVVSGPNETGTGRLFGRRLACKDFSVVFPEPLVDVDIARFFMVVARAAHVGGSGAKI